MLDNPIADMLKQTSRTFYISIANLPDGFQEAVASGYLCMRAIDEIEDHATLSANEKVAVLRETSYLLQTQIGNDHFPLNLFDELFNQYPQLPEVSQKLATWAAYAPHEVAPSIWHNTSAMADRMAYWAQSNWRIGNQLDLDAYLFSVAGTVGLMICDVWNWHAKEQLDRNQAVLFGRALQLVNIIRNHQEDSERGVSFIPDSWDFPRMIEYARLHLNRTHAYMNTLQAEPLKYVIRLPLELAIATLDIIEKGGEKLTRDLVAQIAQRIR